VCTRINQKQSATAEVNGQLNFVMQKIQYLVKQSSNIEIPAGLTTSTLKLRMEDDSQDPTCLSLVSGVIKLAQGHDAANKQNCVSNASDLTNSRVVVNTFNFQKISQYPGHDTVSINIQMSYNAADPASQTRLTLQSAIARVSAATFDSDLVPGGTYNYNLGQAGAPWQKILMADGTAANPAYSFGNDTNLGMFKITGSSILGFSTAGLERMRINASGNVGIGTTTPATLFTVANAGVNIFNVLSNGNVGIGAASPAAKLEVNGNVMIDSGGSINHAVCWKGDGKTLGYCSNAPNSSGVCTCQ